MKTNPIFKVLFAYLIPILLCASLARANDSAVETSVGGLKLRKLHAVSMEKERLFVSSDKVIVEYEFLNKTKSPVSSEVAFPLPPFRYILDDLAGNRDFGDFKAWVNDAPCRSRKKLEPL
jgi:hypothetical protein